MGSYDEVNTFLKEFKQKAKIYDPVFYPRGKNSDTLLALGITAHQRLDYLMNLTVENYYRGPTEDIDPGRPAYYEFGIIINNQEIYIKLSLGKFNKAPHCMSFHIAKHKLDYPLKEK